MAVKIENDSITADSKEDLKQSLQERWSEICQRSARKAAEDAIKIHRWEANVKMINQALLAVAAALMLTVPLNCLLIIRLNMLANAYISSLRI